VAYTADSIRFENESDGRFDSRFDSNEKKRFAGPYYAAPCTAGRRTTFTVGTIVDIANFDIGFPIFLRRF